jgi:hypothetical protein
MAHRGRTSQSGRTISDADRARLLEGEIAAQGEGLGREVTRRARVPRAPNKSGRTISEADRARFLEAYINRNDGGIAKKTRNF